MPTTFLPLSEFKSWLAANATTIVGQPCLSCDCPIANFLKYKHNFQPVVYSTFFTFRGDPAAHHIAALVPDYNFLATHYLPPWALGFITATDRQADSDSPQSLTGQTCLSLLSEISNPSNSLRAPS